MTSPADAAGIDCAWIACDSDGHVAAIITAGSGTIPDSIFDGPVDLFDLEERLLQLPVLSDAAALATEGDLTSFLDLARRGLYVFDWTDIHRALRKSVGAYEMVARPATVLRVDDLPGDLKAVAQRHRLSSTFGDRLTLDMLED